MKYEIGKCYRYDEVIVKILSHCNDSDYKVKCLYAYSGSGWIAGETEYAALIDGWEELDISESQIYRNDRGQLVKVLKIEESVEFMYLCTEHDLMGRHGFEHLSKFLSDYTLETCPCGLPRRWLNAETRGKYCWSCK